MQAGERAVAVSRLCQRHGGIGRRQAVPRDAVVVDLVRRPRTGAERQTCERHSAQPERQMPQRETRPHGFTIVTLDARGCRKEVQEHCAASAQQSTSDAGCPLRVEPGWNSRGAPRYTETVTVLTAHKILISSAVA